MRFLSVVEGPSSFFLLPSAIKSKIQNPKSNDSHLIWSLANSNIVICNCRHFSSQSGSIFFWTLGYIAIFGIGWDILYIYIQHFRWDRDWPGAFQLLAGIWEAVFVLFLIKIIGLPGIPEQDFELGAFALHYSFVWLAIYLASQTLMRILFPYWRFRGGQWL
jgi:hypothetical protein